MKHTTTTSATSATAATSATIYELVNNYLLITESFYSYLQENDYLSLCHEISNNNLTKIDAIKFLRNATSGNCTKVIDNRFITENYPSNKFIMYMQQSAQTTENTYNDVDIVLQVSQKISCKTAADIINFLWDNIDFYYATLDINNERKQK